MANVPIGDPRPAGEEGAAGDQRKAGEDGPAGDPRPAGQEKQSEPKAKAKHTPQYDQDDRPRRKKSEG